MLQHLINKYLSTLLLFILLTVWGQFFYSIYLVLSDPAKDYEVFYLATNYANQGNNPYGEIPNKDPFKNPPPSLLFYSIFSRFPIIESQMLWTLTSLIAFILGSYFLLKSLEVKYINTYFTFQQIVIIYFILVAIFFPFRHNFGSGQINNFFFLLINSSFYFMVKHKFFYFAVNLGIAIMLKITPLIFIFLLFVQHKFKLILMTFVAILFMNLITISIYGKQIINNFLDITPGFFDRGISSYYNQSLSAFLNRAFDNLFLTNFITNILLFVALIVFVGIVVKSKKSALSELLIWSLGIIYILIFSSYAWQYQFVIIIFSIVATTYIGLKIHAKKQFFVLLLLSYLLIGFNIKNPALYQSMGFWGSVITSHVFIGSLLLLALNYYLAIKLIKE